MRVGLGHALYSSRRWRLIFTLTAACCIPQVGTADDGYIHFSGRYENRGYAYTVVIPAGLTGSKVRPPAPVHGFFIPLAEEAKIDVNADYNTLEYPSASKAAAAEIEWFVEQCSKDAQVTSSPSRLGTLAAVRTVVRCVNRKSNQHVVLDTVVALRQTTTPPDIILAICYDLILITAQERYPNDAKVYEQVLRSFRLAEIKRVSGNR